MKKDPIIILGSSLNPREAAHPQCHKCLCYRCKPTNRQRERSALQDFLYPGGMRAEFPSPAYVEPCVSVTVPGVVSGSPCSYLFASISPLYPSPVSLALSPPQAFVSFPCLLQLGHLQTPGLWHGASDLVALIRIRLCPPLPLCGAPPPVLPTTHALTNKCTNGCWCHSAE